MPSKSSGVKARPKPKKTGPTRGGGAPASGLPRQNEPPQQSPDAAIPTSRSLNGTASAPSSSKKPSKSARPQTTSSWSSPARDGGRPGRSSRRPTSGCSDDEEDVDFHYPPIDAWPSSGQDGGGGNPATDVEDPEVHKEDVDASPSPPTATSSRPATATTSATDVVDVEVVDDDDDDDVIIPGSKTDRPDQTASNAADDNDKEIPAVAADAEDVGDEKPEATKSSTDVARRPPPLQVWSSTPQLDDNEDGDGKGAKVPRSSTSAPKPGADDDDGRASDGSLSPPPSYRSPNQSPPPAYHCLWSSGSGARRAAAARGRGGADEAMELDDLSTTGASRCRSGSGDRRWTVGSREPGDGRSSSSLADEQETVADGPRKDDGPSNAR